MPSCTACGKTGLIGTVWTKKILRRWCSCWQNGLVTRRSWIWFRWPPNFLQQNFLFRKLVCISVLRRKEWCKKIMDKLPSLVCQSIIFLCFCRNVLYQIILGVNIMMFHLITRNYIWLIHLPGNCSDLKENMVFISMNSTCQVILGVFAKL